MPVHKVNNTNIKYPVKFPVRFLIRCPFCNSTKVKKQGKRKSKLQITQKYLCKKCDKYFSDNEKRILNKTYPAKIILQSISLYNLGHSQQKVSKLIAQRYKIIVPQRTISEWLNTYKNVCTFHKMRKQAIKLYPPDEIIETNTFMHNNLPYKFQIHRAKLKLLFNSELYNNKFSDNKKFEKQIIFYLKKIPTREFPHHIFRPKAESETETRGKLERSSQLKFETLKFTRMQKQNLANKLTNMALNLAKTNKDRHQSVQDFMLINDSTTIATEIPVYLTNDDIKYFLKRGFQLPLENSQTPITGHIDLLQIRNGLIHILDYKPGADKINPINQLTIYALALASRFQIPLKSFKCAWFDDKNYYEFFPLHVVYALLKKK
ncbi:MAG: PD-(D/E)XK nuclease family protein [Nanoarchaeota archaeon]